VQAVYTEAHNSLLAFYDKLYAYEKELEDRPIQAVDFTTASQDAAVLFNTMGMVVEHLNRNTRFISAILTAQIHIRELYAIAGSRLSSPTMDSWKVTMKRHESELEKQREKLQLHRQDLENYLRVLNGIQYRSPLRF
jgi:hypothetical protein